MLLTALILIAVLSLLVFVHELGHFVTAKRAGVRVDEFGFGFPPRMVGIKKGGTLYSINWIPLGGFVKIKGESGENRGDRDSFASKPAWVRALILLAGVGMNVVLCWVLLSIGYVIGSPQVAEDLSSYARVTDAKVQVVSVLENSPASRAGLEPGDVIVSIAGEAVTDGEVVRNRTAAHAGEEIALSLRRRGEALEKTATPETLAESGKPGIGVALVRTGTVSYPWYIAPLEGAYATWSLTGEIFSAFGSLFADLVRGRGIAADVSGPVGIVVVTADVAKLGFRHLLQFTALLSLNLAVLNVLPFPALDGGRLLFVLIEKIRGRTVGRNIEATAHGLGFGLLMLLVLVITYRDVLRFGDRIIGAFAPLFGA